MTTPPNNTSHTPQQGSAESAARIQALIDKGMTPEQAAAALAASNQMAQVDPAALVADQVLQDVLQLRKIHGYKSRELQTEFMAAVDAEAQKRGIPKGQPLPNDILSEEVSAAFEARGRELDDKLLRITEVATQALTAHIAMRAEQRQEIIWGEQSHALAEAEKNAMKKGHPGFASAKKSPAQPPKGPKAA